MKRFLFTLTLIGLSILIKAQCNISDLFPFKIGMTKYQVRNLINLQNNVSDIEENDFFDSWETYKELPNDSIYCTSIGYDFQIPCFKEYQFHACLWFSDDYLYKMGCWFNFEQKDYKQMLNIYNTLLSVYSNSYSYSEHFSISRMIGDNCNGYIFSGINDIKKTYEQMGEGWNFYSKDEDKMFVNPHKEPPNKAEWLTINYDLENYNIETRKYMLSFIYTDNRKTKQDRFGNILTTNYIKSNRIIK